MSVLFLLKLREDYSQVTGLKKNLSTGLFNSANFMHEMLLGNGIESNIEVCVDNNEIDKYLTMHRPTHAIIEALWVVPSKFAELIPLHKNVEFIIRLHSEMPFMAGEGMAMDWIGDYVTYKQVKIGVNAPRMLEEIRKYLQIKMGWNRETTEDRVIYLPNYYPQDYEPKTFDDSKDTIDIGCFGAVRPLKNHLVQAFGAIKFADKIGKKLNFHINADRLEMQGGPALHNLIGLFNQLNDRGYTLVGHTWQPHEEFKVLCSQMDIGLQVSFSETFNIVGADIVTMGVPLVGSSEIPWSTRLFNADPTNSDDIARKLYRAYKYPRLNVWLNQGKMRKYVDRTMDVWVEYFDK